MICKECGREFERSKRNDNIGCFCSNKCFEQWRVLKREPNCQCVVCQKPIYKKPYTIKRNINGVTCSKECSLKLRSQYCTGKNNHQYGLTGDKNASFKNQPLLTNYGYIIEFAPNHPFPHDRSNIGTRVLQHRLVIEQNYQLFDPKYFIIINGKHYLKQEYAVHHINEIRTDNRLENLQIMLNSDHTRLHNQRKKILRDRKSGRIIGIVKSGKNGEP